MKKTILFIILSSFLSSAKAQSPTEIWGITITGGSGFGTLFKTDANGNNQVVLNNFKGELPGRFPLSKFCEVNSKLYIAMEGGIYDDGIIAELDPVTGKMIKKNDFNHIVNGSHPVGLTLASNGKLYGVMSNYDPVKEGKGAIFEYDVSSNNLIKRVDFNGANGTIPYCEMIAATNGKLYGVSQWGGDNDKGVLFEYDPLSNLIEKKISFDDTTNGSSATHQLIQAKNGKLYGMTTIGGLNALGTIFEYDITTNVFTTKYHFGGSNNGSIPRGGLEEDNDGYLYGTTTGGDGTAKHGVLFKFDPAHSTVTKLIEFDEVTAGGFQAGGTLKKGNNGLIYGMMMHGGINNSGTIFEFNPSTSKLTTKFDFDPFVNGKYPVAQLVQASNGKLYSTTNAGGLNNLGVVFEYDLVSNSYKKLFDLSKSDDGASPSGTLYLSGYGKIYLATSGGGENGNGVLIEADPSLNAGTFKKIIDFDRDVNGANPIYAPIQAMNGNLYGTTRDGGVNNVGTLYEFNPISGIFSTKFHFEVGKKGYYPSGLIRASNEKIYGTTDYGGDNYGVLFEFDPATGVYEKKIDFKDWGVIRTSGYLMEAENRKLYGVAAQEMGSGHGILFEYDFKKDTLVTKIKFDDKANGFDPCGTLVEARVNSKLYGLTTNGGTSNGGVIYEYDPVTNTYKKLYDFDDSVNGRSPKGSLLLAANGKLYGMTSAGGIYNRGVLFEFDFTNGTFTKKIDFTGSNGSSPFYNNLLEVCKSIEYHDLPSTTSVCESTSFTIKSGITKSGHTFQWYINAGSTPVPFATSEDLTITSAKLSDTGIYTCKVSNGCTTIHTVNKKIDVLPLGDINCNGVGMNENNIDSPFKVYPNPANDYVHIQINDPSVSDIRIELVNLLGQTVYKEEGNLLSGKNTVSIPLGLINNGIYYVMIMNAQKLVLKTEKLIKN